MPPGIFAAMNLSRRAFLKAGAAASGAALLASRPELALARGLLTEPTLDELVQRTLAAAKKAGATYADVRVVRRRAESVFVRDAAVEGVSSTDEYGVGVRVIAGGAWGFAASPRVLATEGERCAALAVSVARAHGALRKAPVALAPTPVHVDVWQTPLTKDPFKIPLEDKAELLLAISAEARKVAGIRFVMAQYDGTSEWKLLASSEGAYLEQQIVRVGPGYTVSAVDEKRGGFASRKHDFAPRQGGWEVVTGSPLLADARQTGEECLQKLAAPPVTPGRRDVVIDPSNLWLTIHETIGHSTELDRALGYEANFAGTSFATPAQLRKLRIGAPHITFYADKTTPGGLATCGYDDDGVATGRWNLVERGLFVGYQTTREQAAWIGEPASRGTSYADSYGSVPFQRMPNVSLAPGARDLSLDDLIAATDDGVLIVGDGSWSIDHQRKNFQFGGQLFWEIKKGKKTRMLKDLAYQSSTIAFWNACDLIGGASAWRLGGAMRDGKGEPVQTNPISHGTPPVRVRQVELLATGRSAR
jgi:TldD protein